MKHLYISTPAYGGMTTGFYTQSALQTLSVASQYECTMSFNFLFNESLIQRARNLMAHQFLKSEASHLMWIDADIQWHPHDPFRMLEKDLDIICGLYPKKEINWAGVATAAQKGVPAEQFPAYTGSVVCNLVEDIGPEGVRADTPIEIRNGGTGFMLIKREVMETLAKSLPKYRNDMTILGNSGDVDEITEFFPVYICPTERRLLSEDYAFCTLARQAGYKIHAAPWVNLGHYGNYLYQGGLVPVNA